MHSLKHLLELAKTNQTYECEARFGYYIKRASGKPLFTTSFDKTLFEQLLTSVANSVKEHAHLWTECTALDAPQSLQNQYFPNNIRGRYYQDGVAEFHRVYTVETVDDFASDTDIKVRISVKEELPITYTPLTPPISVRLQHRWSFVYKNMFRYDLSEVAMGTNVHDATQSTCSYEVEIELLPGAYAHPNLLQSFIMKIEDITMHT